MDEEKKGTVVKAGKTTCACGDGCQCGCGYGYRGGSRVIWWVIVIAVLVFVFAVGVKAGEFRDELRSAFGNYYYRGYPMMQDRGYGGGVAVPVTGVQGSPADVTATGTTEAPMMPVQQ